MLNAHAPFEPYVRLLSLSLLLTMVSGFRKLKHSFSAAFSHSPPSPPSSSSSFSRTLSVRSFKKTCSICLSELKVGQGGAIFVAECSHSFHFHCIASNVKHGNHVCPICRSKWKELPFEAPSRSVHVRQNISGRVSVSNRSEPDYFTDDEPLPPTIAQHGSSAAPNVIAVKSYAEYPVVCASKSYPNFAFLARIHAPPLSQRNRAPVDLVAVLDLSDSMAGAKLALVKQAVHFVIQNMSSSDRLSVVVFSSTARRVFPLRRMNDAGRADATVAVNSLLTNGGTNIVAGLRKGLRVLEERSLQNPVSSIILLSDGNSTPRPNQPLDYLLPASVRFGNSVSIPKIPVHTFGFGRDHDANTLHDISDASWGTFSFIESVGMVQEAFARCIGGLLSVVAQEVQLTVRALSPGVRIGSIRSGRYISEICDEGKRGVIDVGDLYAEEEKGFLFYLSILDTPAGEGEEIETKISLLDVSCQYKDSASEERVQVMGERVEIRRSKTLLLAQMVTSLEVDRQRNRILVADCIAEAYHLAERGDLVGAKDLLAAKRSILSASASAEEGDAVFSWLDAELRETRERMESLEEYQNSGRSYALSGLSSHTYQRGNTTGDSSTSLSGGSGLSGSYDTPSMITLMRRSQILSGWSIMSTT